MVRRCTGFALALAPILVLGLAMARAHAHQLPDSAIWFSAPCGPAAPAFQAAEQSKAVSRIDSSLHAANGEAPFGLVAPEAHCGSTVRAVPPPAPGTFPPLLHRPPPIHC